MQTKQHDPLDIHRFHQKEPLNIFLNSIDSNFKKTKWVFNVLDTCFVLRSHSKYYFIHPAYPARYCIPSFLGLGSHHHRQRDTRRNPHRDITRSTCFSRGCTSAPSMRFWTCGETLPGMTLWFHVWLPTKSNMTRAGTYTRNWRCMSYWKWGFCNGMLVNSKVYCINRYEQIWRM